MGSPQSGPMSIIWMQVILEGHNLEKHGEGVGEVRQERERATESKLMSRLAHWAIGAQSHCAPQDTVWTHLGIVQGDLFTISSSLLGVCCLEGL